METYPPALRRPDLVDLADGAATDGSLVGAKAANLARARRAGLPVLPGAVLTTAWDHRGWSHPSRFDRPSPARDAWRALTEGGTRPVVVRSSSTNEDGGASSMAGVFTSVLDVTGWTGFVDAVDRVLDSGRLADVHGALMAVLVQPQLAPRWGGVLFGADPVSGRTDRLLVSAVEGGPDTLVSGLDDGWTAVLSPRGRILENRGAGDLPLPGSVLRALAKLAARAAAAFGGPQDIEWAVDHDGTVWLLQSRPITTPTGKPGGPVLGAGPLAETFPDPLAPLETDLWLSPLGEGLEHALRLTGTAAPRALRRSPVARSLGGWAVADLAHLGMAPVRHRILRKLDPRPPARRLRAAWRTGRLSRALPTIARDVVEQVDRDLASVPRLDDLSNAELLAVLDNGRTALRALHGYEALAGMLVGDAAGDGATAASLALSALAEARAEGVSDDELVETDPVVLALSPPRIGSEPVFDLGPAVTIDLRAGPGGTATAAVPASARVPEPASDAAVVREALRLRARWVQELSARAAWLLGHRLVCVGVLPEQQNIRLLGFDELRAAVRMRRTPVDLELRTDPALDPPRALPAQFRLTSDGTPVAVAPPTAGPGGVGAGGGSGSGPVHVGDDPPVGAVLVVAHLDPRLAAVVPRLAGLVAETGSPLSHLAILAREHGVPTVVGHAGATGRYAPGQVLEVDGTMGTVRVVGELPSIQDADDRAGDDNADGDLAEPARADVPHVIVLPTRPVAAIALDDGSDIDATRDDDADERVGAETGTDVSHDIPRRARRSGGNIVPIGGRR
jgi:phosphohistidine swiveling domain-containing protein